MSPQAPTTTTKEELDELRLAAITTEDHAYVDDLEADAAEKSKLDQERLEALGHAAVPELTIQDNVVVPVEEVQAQRDAGQDTSTYTRY